MKIEIRKIGDVETLLPMRIEVIRCVFGIDDDAELERLRDENRHYYARHLADGTHETCFAYVDGQLAGCGAVCYYQEMPSPDNPNGECAYLMNIYTRAEYRGHGVAHAVVEWLISRARTRSATKIYLESTPAALHLYASLGFRPLPAILKLQ